MWNEVHIRFLRILGSQMWKQNPPTYPLWKHCIVNFNSCAKKISVIVACESLSHQASNFSCNLLCSLDKDKNGTDTYQVQSWPEKSSYSANYVLLLQKPDHCVESYTWLLWENQFLLYLILLAPQSQGSDLKGSSDFLYHPHSCFLTSICLCQPRVAITLQKG